MTNPLNQALKTQHLTQKQVADKLAKLTGDNWSQAKVSRVVNGKKAHRLKEVRQICEAFGFDVIEMLKKLGLL